MILDFSFILVAATLLTGVIWGLDSWLFKPAREREAAVQPAAADGTPAPVREPLAVEYARSFFPVILIVLLVRSFLFEPFRIPSDSMMPTLLDGDFIFVNKFTYGLRLPVLNTRIVPISDPHRGDVIVFRKPRDPSVNYIKRLIGLPGDHIKVDGRALYVNEKLMTTDLTEDYVDPYPEDVSKYVGARDGVEHLDGVDHRIMFMPPDQGYNKVFEQDVPAGQYFFMGDNRDNSSDSRFADLGFVPEGNVVGKAVRIWLNWRWPHAPQWGRIGSAIH
jgi:signal peptidase I